MSDIKKWAKVTVLGLEEKLTWSKKDQVLKPGVHCYFVLFAFFKIRIHSIQGCKAITRHDIKRKKEKKI